MSAAEADAEQDLAAEADAPHRLAGEVAATARLLAAAGLVEAFGHVSARTEVGFLITSTTPLLEASAASVHHLDPSGASGGAEGVPLEAHLHAALYATRPDVGAVCRTHSRFAVALGVRSEAPPLLHGLGGLSGQVALYDGPELIATSTAGDLAARAIGDADCLLLRGNGALATGDTLAQAAVRAYHLEERCRVAIDAGSNASSLSAAELAGRSRWFDQEQARAFSWLLSRFGGGS